MTDRHCPSVVERYKDFISLFFVNQPGVLSYRLTVADNLDDAYVGQNASPFNGVAGAHASGTEILFTVGQGSHYRSRSTRKKGWGIIEESTRNQTRAMFSMDDFHNPPTTTAVPPDKDIAFLRAQVNTMAMAPGTYGSEGPILILQNPGFAGVPRPALTFSGTAPAVGAVAGLPPPPNSMEIRVPFYGDSLVFLNHSDADPIFVSTGPGIPMLTMPPEVNFTHTSGQDKTLIVAANATNPTFSVLITSTHGQR